MSGKSRPSEEVPPETTLEARLNATGRTIYRLGMDIVADQPTGAKKHSAAYIGDIVTGRRRVPIGSAVLQKVIAKIEQYER